MALSMNVNLLKTVEETVEMVKMNWMNDSILTLELNKRFQTYGEQCVYKATHKNFTQRHSHCKYEQLLDEEWCKCKWDNKPCHFPTKRVRFCPYYKQMQKTARDRHE